VNTNFEEIFGSALDWLVKKGDKRNIACKAPPPVNHFQSNNDQNLSLKNIFRGLGIFLFQKTPKYAQSDNGTEEERTPDQQERDTDAIIADSFKNYNIDPDNLMLYTQRQMVEKATPIASRAGDSALNQKRADDILEQRQDIQRRSLVSTKRNEAGNTDTGTKNMFRSFASWVQSLNTLGEDAKTIVTTANNKDDC